MRFIKLLSLAGISAAAMALFAGEPLRATTMPNFGGTLRIELHGTSISLDPRQWKAGSPASSESEKLAALVYDRLVTLDDYGRFQPVLASEWSHDASWKNWQFKLRAGVKFSDGSLLSAADVVAALQPQLAPGMQISANESGVLVRGNRASPDLLEQLASGGYFVYRVKADGTLAGTGPFVVAEYVPAPSGNAAAAKSARIKLAANEECWAGRPFVDAVQVTLGEPALRQFFDLQTGRADVAEIEPDLVRRARQENLRVWSSAPTTLLALRFDETQGASGDDRLREAVALSMDRETMANVLLQREAEPASALLPQWLSGYAFLFGGAMDLERAKTIRAALPANMAGGNDPLRLRVDAAGDLLKLIGERVAINARQANLLIQVVPHAAGTVGENGSNPTMAGKAGLHLVAWHYESLSPRAELEALVKHLNLRGSTDSAGIGNEPEQLLAEEQRVLEERWILPLMILPEYVGIGANVRNWNAAQWGEWRLADVWLDGENSDSSAAEGAGSTSPGTARMRGAHP